MASARGLRGHGGAMSISRPSRVMTVVPSAPRTLAAVNSSVRRMPSV